MRWEQKSPLWRQTGMESRLVAAAELMTQRLGKTAQGWAVFSCSQGCEVKLQTCPHWLTDRLIDSFEKRSCYVIQGGFKLVVHLPQPAKYWDSSLHQHVLHFTCNGSKRAREWASQGEVKVLWRREKIKKTWEKNENVPITHEGR